MVNGNLQLKTNVDQSLPYGAVRTTSGRISAATPRGRVPQTGPFSVQDLLKLDEALIWSSERVSVRFSVFIGDLVGDEIASAARIFTSAPEPENGCLIAVSPNSHDVVILSGTNVSDRITQNVARLGVSSAISTLQEGNLIDGIIAAINVIVSAIKDL